MNECFTFPAGAIIECSRGLPPDSITWGAVTIFTAGILIGFLLARLTLFKRT